LVEHGTPERSGKKRGAVRSDEKQRKVDVHVEDEDYEMDDDEEEEEEL
jgi:hypothetical protein